MTDQVPKEVCAPVTRQECREVTSHGHQHDVDARDVHAGNAGDGDDDDENLSLGENTKR